MSRDQYDKNLNYNKAGGRRYGGSSRPSSASYKYRGKDQDSILPPFEQPSYYNQNAEAGGNDATAYGGSKSAYGSSTGAYGASSAASRFSDSGAYSGAYGGRSAASRETSSAGRGDSLFQPYDQPEHAIYQEERINSRSSYTEALKNADRNYGGDYARSKTYRDYSAGTSDYSAGTGNYSSRSGLFDSPSSRGYSAQSSQKSYRDYPARASQESYREKSERRDYQKSDYQKSSYLKSAYQERDYRDRNYHDRDYQDSDYLNEGYQDAVYHDAEQSAEPYAAYQADAENRQREQYGSEDDLLQMVQSEVKEAKRGLSGFLESYYYYDKEYPEEEERPAPYEGAEEAKFTPARERIGYDEQYYFHDDASFDRPDHDFVDQDQERAAAGRRTQAGRNAQAGGRRAQTADREVRASGSREIKEPAGAKASGKSVKARGKAGFKNLFKSKKADPEPEGREVESPEIKYVYSEYENPPIPDESKTGQKAGDADGLQEKAPVGTGGLSVMGATVVTMFGMALAKMTGFLREMLIVPKFGYGEFSDSYYYSFQIPDLIYDLLVGGAVAAVLTPTLAAGIEQKREKKAWYSVNVLITHALLVLAIVLLMAYILMPYIVPTLFNAPQNAEEAYIIESTIEMVIPVTRVLLLQTMMMTMISILQGVLVAYRKFGKSSLGPSIYNIGYLCALLIWGDKNLEALINVAWGVVGAAGIYLLYQIILARHELRFFRINFDRSDREYKKLIKLAMPTLISGSIMQLNVIITNHFTAGVAGQATTLRQANTTWSLPYSVFAVAIGNVALPGLSAAVASRNKKLTLKIHNDSIRRALFLILPCAVFFALTSYETIRAVFQWNPANYSNDEVSITAGVLPILCITMIAQTVIFICNQVFFAFRKTRFAMYGGIGALILNPALCLLFTRVFDWGVKGLAAANAIYSTILALGLYTIAGSLLQKDRLFSFQPYLSKQLGTLLWTTALIYPIVILPFNPAGKIAQLFLYGFKFLASFAIYFITALALEMEEAIYIQNSVFSFFNLPPPRDRLIAGEA